MSTQILPYLYFAGDCRAAMDFYHACLGGELHMQAIKETPVAGQFTAAEADLIMHAELKNGEITIMASDMLRDRLQTGNQISLMLNCSSEAELRSTFEALAKGGKVDQPIRTEFWGAIYGQLTDKFGLHWMLNYNHS
jgi:PhnB protein